MFAPVDIERADPGTLIALADYFTSQARLLRDAAADRQRRERAAAAARARHQAARDRALRLGARVCALARLRGSTSTALAILAQRHGCSMEAIRAAHSAWLRLRDDRRVKVRNFEIWKAKIAGVPSRDLAKRYRLTVRQVDKIAAHHGRTLSAR